MQYEIRRVSLGSIARFGCLAGIIAALPPALCVGAVFLALVRRFSQLFTDMQDFAIDPEAIDLGLVNVDIPPIPVNLTQPLGLAQTAETVRSLADRGAVLFVISALALLLLGALVLTLIALAIGGFYNLLAPRLGGIKVELSNE